MRRNASFRATLVVLSALSLATAAGLQAASASSVYTLAATKKCLVGRGAKVTSVRPTDRRLRALHDLAQRNSIQATSRLGTVGLAFSRSASEAALLAELLQVPRDPYHVVLRKNALLMFRNPSRAAFDAAVTCLRPR